MDDYAIKHLIADIAALIDASSATRVVLLGHDWGGIVAWTSPSAASARSTASTSSTSPIRPASPAACTAGQILRTCTWQHPTAWLPERILARKGACGITEAMLQSSTAPETFPRDLLAATQANAAQPGALTAMHDWYRVFVRGGGLRRQHRLGWPLIDVRPSCSGANKTNSSPNTPQRGQRLTCETSRWSTYREFPLGPAGCNGALECGIVIFLRP